MLIFSILHLSEHSLSLDQTVSLSAGKPILIDLFNDSSSNCLLVQIVKNGFEFPNIPIFTFPTKVDLLNKIEYLFIHYTQDLSINCNKAPPALS